MICGRVHLLFSSLNSPSFALVFCCTWFARALNRSQLVCVCSAAQFSWFRIALRFAHDLLFCVFASSQFECVVSRSRRRSPMLRRGCSSTRCDDSGMLCLGRGSCCSTPCTEASESSTRLFSELFSLMFSLACEFLSACIELKSRFLNMLERLCIACCRRAGYDQWNRIRHQSSRYAGWLASSLVLPTLSLEVLSI